MNCFFGITKRPAMYRSCMDYGVPYLPLGQIRPCPTGRQIPITNMAFLPILIGQNLRLILRERLKKGKKIIEAHREIPKRGLMWTLAYHPRIPEIVRGRKYLNGEPARMNTAGRMVGQSNSYIREARRMLSVYVMTQRPLRRT